MRSSMDCLRPALQTTSTISDNVLVITVVPSANHSVTHIVKTHFDTKVHIYAFIKLILNDANKITTF